MGLDQQLPPSLDQCATLGNVKIQCGLSYLNYKICLLVAFDNYLVTCLLQASLFMCSPSYFISQSFSVCYSALLLSQLSCVIAVPLCVHITSRCMFKATEVLLMSSEARQPAWQRIRDIHFYMFLRKAQPSNQSEDFSDFCLINMFCSFLFNVIS